MKITMLMAASAAFAILQLSTGRAARTTQFECEYIRMADGRRFNVVSGQVVLRESDDRRRFHAKISEANPQSGYEFILARDPTAWYSSRRFAGKILAGNSMGNLTTGFLEKGPFPTNLANHASIEILALGLVILSSPLEKTQVNVVNNKWIPSSVVRAMEKKKLSLIPRVVSSPGHTRLEFWLCRDGQVEISNVNTSTVYLAAELSVKWHAEAQRWERIVFKGFKFGPGKAGADQLITDHYIYTAVAVAESAEDLMEGEAAYDPTIPLVVKNLTADKLTAQEYSGNSILRFYPEFTVSEK